MSAIRLGEGAPWRPLWDIAQRQWSARETTFNVSLDGPITRAGRLHNIRCAIEGAIDDMDHTKPNAPLRYAHLHRRLSRVLEAQEGVR